MVVGTALPVGAEIAQSMMDMSRIVFVTGLLSVIAGCRGLPLTTTPDMPAHIGVGRPASVTTVADVVDRRMPSAAGWRPTEAAPSTEPESSPSSSRIVPASYVPGDGAAVTAEPEPAPIPLTLQSAIETGLRRNPDLIALRSGEAVAHAAVHVASTYPFNPQWQTQVMPYAREPNGDFDPATQSYALVQTFELAHQRRYRVGAALANQSQVQGTIRQAELLNVAQTERLFFTALYRRALRDLNQSLADLNEQLVGVVERRMQAGRANAADVALARLQAQSARRQQRLAEADYQSAVTNLSNHLNLDADVTIRLIGELPRWQWRPVEDVPSVPTALRQLVADRPDVVAARAAAAKAQQTLALADAMRRPNVQLGPLYQRDNGAVQYWGIQAQVDLPVVDSGRPLVRQRLAELRQQQITASQTEDKAVLQARAALERYERARRLVKQSRDRSATDVSEALKLFEDQFQAGQIDLLQVFAARTTVLQSRQSFLDLLNELAQAAADVTAAIGLPAEQLVLQMPASPSQPEGPSSP